MSNSPLSRRVILPANKLAAIYDPKKNALTVSAEGTYDTEIFNGRFIRLRSIGGLKLLLVGWALKTGPGPEGPPFKFPFEVSTLFKLSLLPGQGLTVIDRHHPKGVHVPIRFLGYGSDTDTPQEDAPKEVSQVPEKTLPDDKTITVLDAEPFTISAPASYPHAYTYDVDVEFDPNVLTLTNSKIEGGQIVWTFVPHKTVDTQVIVTELGSMQPPPSASTWWQEQTYHIHVIVL